MANCFAFVTGIFLNYYQEAVQQSQWKNTRKRSYFMEKLMRMIKEKR